jgi:hypothetical protein
MGTIRAGLARNFPIGSCDHATQRQRSFADENDDLSAFLVARGQNRSGSSGSRRPPSGSWAASAAIAKALKGEFGGFLTCF